MKITKLQLKQIVKEELQSVLSEQEETEAVLPVVAAMADGKAELDSFARQAVSQVSRREKIGPLRQFIEQNPEAADYFGSGAVAIKRNAKGPIDPNWREKGEATGGWTIARYKSKDERRIDYGMFKIMRKTRGPHVKGSTQIAVIGYDTLVSKDNTRLRVQGGKDFMKKSLSDVGHHITKAYFYPKETLENYTKEYGDKAQSMYKYTADQIENLIRRPVPGSTNTGGELTKRIYLYSYLWIKVRLQGKQTGNIRG
jgi:hypothetical protein